MDSERQTGMRIGVIGYGLRAHSVLNEALRLVASDVVLAGIVDPDEAGVRAKLAPADRGVKFYASMAELVKQAKPDALFIGTRCNLHTPLAIEAKPYGLPLYLEKPVAISLEQANALETSWRGAFNRVVVSFPLRVSPLCVKARAEIAAGLVGTPLHVAGLNYVNYGSVYFGQGYRDYAVTQGLFLQKATHDLDYLMYLMNEPIVRIGAMETKGKTFGGNKPAELRCRDCAERETCLESPKNTKRNSSGSPNGDDRLCVFSAACGTPQSGMNEDASSAVFEFASGAHGVYTQVFFARRDAGRRGAIVSGYQGTLSFDWSTAEINCIQHHAPFSSVIRHKSDAGHFGGDLELADDFINLVKYGQTPRATLREGLQSVYACLAAKESAATGKFAWVRQVG